MKGTLKSRTSGEVGGSNTDPHMVFGCLGHTTFSHHDTTPDHLFFFTNFWKILGFTLQTLRKPWDLYQLISDLQTENQGICSWMHPGTNVPPMGNPYISPIARGYL